MFPTAINFLCIPTAFQGRRPITSVACYSRSNSIHILFKPLFCSLSILFFFFRVDPHAPFVNQRCNQSPPFNNRDKESFHRARRLTCDNNNKQPTFIHNKKSTLICHILALVKLPTAPSLESGKATNTAHHIHFRNT